MAQNSTRPCVVIQLQMPHFISLFVPAYYLIPNDTTPLQLIRFGGNKLNQDSLGSVALVEVLLGVVTRVR